MQTPLNDEDMDLLVAYALDALEPAETAKVTRLLRERPELQVTLDELRSTAGLLPYGLPEAAPPPDLRQSVLAHAVGRPAPQTSAPKPAQAPARRGWLWGLGGLATGALAVAAAFAVQLGGLRGELAVAQQSLATAQASQQQLAQVVAQPVALAELNGDAGRATVLRTSDGELLVAASLPQLEAERVYQLWLIEGQAAPVSAGIFTVDSAGTALITLETGRDLSGATLAVTNEPAPGSSGPTTDILIAGTISA
jgi:anti-sigma-K factor RskA